MATSGEPASELSPRQIVRLAAAISANNMAAIAEGYMGISDETIKNIKFENKDDAKGFNREIIKLWRNKTPDNQVTVSEFFVTREILDIEEEWKAPLLAQTEADRPISHRYFRRQYGGHRGRLHGHRLRNREESQT